MLKFRQNKFSDYLIVLLVIIIITIIFYKRLSLKESIKLPLQIYTVSHHVYFILIFILLLVAIISFIIFQYKIVLGHSFDVVFEYVKQRFEFITIYLDKKYLNIDEIYRYFGYHKKSLIRVYFLINWCPRILVASFFLLDVLYLKHLSYFYKTLPLLLLPFIFRLFYNIFKRHIDTQCSKLNNKVQPVALYEDNNLSSVITLKEYIIQTAMKLLNTANKPKNKGLLLLDPDYIYEWEKETGKKLDYDKTLYNCKKRIERIVMNYIVIYRFETQKTYFETFFNILIRLGYFIGWTYIFNISDPDNFKNVIIFLCKIYTYIEEPFSCLAL